MDTLKILKVYIFGIWVGVMFFNGITFAQATPSGAWQQTLKGASSEGKVMVVGPPAPQFREALIAFQKYFPQIKVEYVGPSLRDFGPRILTERKMEQFLWDVLVGGAETPNLHLKPAGVLDPLEPALMLPEVLSDSAWLGGFNDGWMDREKRFIYGVTGTVNAQVLVDRSIISEEQLNRVEDLVAPKWKGKISWQEPRAPGGGSAAAGYWLHLLGEDFVRKLLQQDIVSVRDRRQQAEWLVKGKYPIGIAVTDAFLDIYRAQGLGLKVEPLAPHTPAGGATRLGAGNGNVVLINRAPNPNAAKIFVNWLLSRQGQEIFVKSTGDNSRRLDVKGPSQTAPKPGVKYININKEELVHNISRAMKIATEVLK
jgi:iron(III) transport system substrate-binding protein